MSAWILCTSTSTCCSSSPGCCSTPLLCGFSAVISGTHTHTHTHTHVHAHARYSTSTILRWLTFLHVAPQQEDQGSDLHDKPGISRPGPHPFSAPQDLLLQHTLLAIRKRRLFVLLLPEISQHVRRHSVPGKQAVDWNTVKTIEMTMQQFLMYLIGVKCQWTTLEITGSNHSHAWLPLPQLLGSNTLLCIWMIFERRREDLFLEATLKVSRPWLSRQKASGIFPFRTLASSVLNTNLWLLLILFSK